jgi:hypothetical protein
VLVTFTTVLPSIDPRAGSSLWITKLNTKLI